MQRSNNKSETTLYITKSGMSFVDTDRFMFGMKMAVSEINVNSSLLQDVTLQINIDDSIDGFSNNIASLYETAIQLCDMNNTIGFLLDMSSGVAISFEKMCPQIGVVYMDYSSFPGVARAYISMCSNQGIHVNAFAPMSVYTAPGLYYPQIKSTFNYLLSTNLRVFVISGASNDIPDVILAARKAGIYGRDYVWSCLQLSMQITSDISTRWGEKVNSSILDGVIALGSDPGNTIASDYTASWLTRFNLSKNELLSTNMSEYKSIDRTVTDEFQEDFPLNLFYDDPGIWTVPAYSIQDGYDTVYALARVWDNIINSNRETGSAVMNKSIASQISLPLILHALSDTNLNLRVHNLNDNGDINTSTNTLMQCISNGTCHDVATFGRNNVTHALTLNLSSLFKWTGNRTQMDVPIGFPPIIYNYISISSPITIVIIAGVIWRNRNIKGIFYRIPTLLAASSSFKMYLVFHGVYFQSSLNRHSITMRKLQMLVGLSFGFVLALVLVQAVEYPYKTSDVFDVHTNSYNSICVASSSTTDILSVIVYVYIGILIFIAAVFAYMNRILPKEYNDAREITISVYSICILSVIGIAQGYSGITSQSQQFYMESVIVFLGVAMIYSVLIGAPLLFEFSRSFRVKMSTRKKSGIHSRLTRPFNIWVSSNSKNQNPSKSHTESFQTWEYIDTKANIVVKVVARRLNETRPSLASRNSSYSFDDVTATSSTNYIRLLSLASVKIVKPDTQKTVVLSISDDTITLQFQNKDDVALWTDAIAHAIMQDRRVNLLEVLGQIIDVQDISIFGISAQ
ncbi:hypothetical protein BASA50_000237 [Batrachochytrium salamandrivorans]|uniref:G-protein coupled receptors family 3 profile domain-containing protein n=1 Tax=Batrachochytrium salamandrivorans TaxID=1357716 RepID=A0ABQ8EXN6_9FUNG|nr:hypothetical protein BASA50_000237 [Batrachochytrium salamandrivorans]